MAGLGSGKAMGGGQGFVLHGRVTHLANMSTTVALSPQWGPRLLGSQWGWRGLSGSPVPGENSMGLSDAILILLSFHSVCACVPHLPFLVTHVTEANDLLKEQSPAPKAFSTFTDTQVSVGAVMCLREAPGAPIPGETSPRCTGSLRDRFSECPAYVRDAD